MKYTESHEWIAFDGSDIAIVGITDFAQKELGDIIYVELPKIGHHLKAGDDAVVLESTKAAVDIYSPLSGEIVEVNEALKENPESINLSAESKGWLFKVRIKKPEELSALMDKHAYERFLHQ